MIWLFLVLFPIQNWATEIRWNPKVLSLPLSKVGFSKSNVLDINRNLRRSQPQDRDFNRLTVRDLVKFPKSQFAYFGLRNEIQERLAELGLALGMTDEDLLLFETVPNHILFQPITVLSDQISETTLSLLRGSKSSRSPRNLLVIDLVEAQRKKIPHSFGRISLVEQVHVAQALDQKLGTDTALMLNRYLESPALAQRMADSGIHTILDLLGATEAGLLSKNIFLNFDEIGVANTLRREFRRLMDPSCEEYLRRYSEDD